MTQLKENIQNTLWKKEGGENPIATKGDRDFEEQNTSTYNNHTQSLTQKTFTDEGRRQRSSCSQRLKALFPPNTLLFFFFFFFYYQDVFFYFARCFLWEHKRDDDEEGSPPLLLCFLFPLSPLSAVLCAAQYSAVERAKVNLWNSLFSLSAPGCSNLQRCTYARTHGERETRLPRETRTGWGKQIRSERVQWHRMLTK